MFFHTRFSMEHDCFFWMFAFGVGLLFISVVSFFLCYQILQEYNYFIVTHVLNYICTVETVVFLLLSVFFLLFSIVKVFIFALDHSQLWIGMIGVIGIPVSVVFIIPLALQLYGIRLQRSGFLILCIILK